MRYMFMSGLLTLVYIVLIFLAIQVMAFHTPAAVAGATVVAALLFNLPRRRLQRAVNRHYHRPA